MYVDASSDIMLVLYVTRFMIIYHEQKNPYTNNMYSILSVVFTKCHIIQLTYSMSRYDISMF